MSMLPINNSCPQDVGHLLFHSTVIITVYRRDCVNTIETMIEAKTLASVIQNTKSYVFKMLQRQSAQ